MTLVEKVLNNYMKDKMRHLSEEQQLAKTNDSREAAQMSHERSITSLERKEFKEFIPQFETEIVSRQLSKASCNGIKSETKRLKCTYEVLNINKKYDNEYIQILNKL